MSQMVDKFYVAPLDPPPSRRPPVTEVGIVKWLRTNFFSSVGDTLITIITGLVIVWLTSAFVRWAFLEAQWEVAFLNLRQLGAGSEYPVAEIWRINLAAHLLIFLCMLAVGYWGRLGRTALIILGLTLAFVYGVPALASNVPAPRAYFLVDGVNPIPQVSFVADAGDEMSFIIDPLAEPSDFGVVNFEGGYIANDNQLPNTSWDLFNVYSTEVTSGQRNPSDYTLNLAVQILDPQGAVLAQSDFMGEGTDDFSYRWTVPADGWYIFRAINENPANNKGVAWLELEEAEVYISTIWATRLREAKYGPPPTLECRNCATELNRTDMRFEGQRTFAQWFSLQAAPFLRGLQTFFLVGVVAGLAAYGLGQSSRRISAPPKLRAPLERFFFIGSVVTILAFIVDNLLVATRVSATGPLEDLADILLGAFVFFVVGYALTLLFKGEARASSRAILILWVAAVPLWFALVKGTGSDTFPTVKTLSIGGLTLTLVLTSVAIIASFPIGILLALGRRSSLPVISLISTVLIEVLRGVPLITLLFMGRLIVPFFADALREVDLVVRMCIVLTLFTSAYLAEVIRGGLQVVSKGQLEAAHALGLSEFRVTTFILLPQALRAVIPAILGQFLSLFKDTSLVALIGLFEITGTMRRILGDTQTGYAAFPREGWGFIFIVYFVLSYIMAEASRKLEQSGSGSIRKNRL